MVDEFTLTLNSPITEEQWDAITDVDFDHTDRIFFHTKHGKEVEFVKVVRCKDCKYYGRADKRRFYRGMDCLNKHIDTIIPDKDYCSKAERREDG